MTLGEVIKEKRTGLNMTQEDLAKALNTTKATVSRWESNQVYNFKRPMISKICELLNIDPFLFFQQYDVITSEEDALLRAYRVANDSTKAAIAKLLDLK